MRVMLTSGDEAIPLSATRLSPSVFAMLGVRPRIGRTFEAREETPGADAVVVLSHRAWRRYFGGMPDVLDQSVTLDGRSYSVIGVMPESFQFPDPQTQIWIPYALGAARARLAPIARLAEGVSVEAASAQVSGILTSLQATGGAPRTAKPSEFRIENVQEQLVAPVRPALVALAISVGAVLLIACVNVANLLLARTAARRREIAVRVALGAGRGRLARQLLTESMLLAIAGGAAGTLFALGGLQLLHALGASLPRGDLTPGVSIPRLEEITIDMSALAFTLVLTVTTGILFGLAPVRRQSSPRYADILREGGSSTTSGFNLLRHHRMQGLLVVAEVAMATVLLVGGGLLMHSFIKLSHVDPGYDPVNLLTFNVPSTGRGPTSFNEDLVAHLQSLPGVRAAGYAELMPMVRFRSGIPIRPAQPFSPGNNPPGPIDSRIVSRDFLRAMGVRVIDGRGFTENDRDGQPRVMLINRTLARSGFLGPNPIGTHVIAGRFLWEVVGIVEDVHQYGLDQDPDPQVFFDTRQLPMSNPSPYFALRAESDPIGLVSTIRAVVRKFDPGATVDNVATMEHVVSNSISRPRLQAVLLGVFAGLAGALAIIGTYGVIAYSVAQRTREIGIRMALGATRANVMRLVLRQSVALIGLGLVLGLTSAAAVTRYLQGMLFGLTPLDPTTLIGVALMFGVVATLASGVPGRRATKVDPIVALRWE
jgi:putative ABC transport system permease protein